MLNDAAAIAAIEVTKVSTFVDYLERNAPGIGDAANYTKNLADGVKEQIQSTGSCPLIGVFEQVSKLIWKFSVALSLKLCFLFLPFLGERYSPKPSDARIRSGSGIH